MKAHHLAIFAALYASGVAAQPAKPVAIRVGPISTARECTLYEGIRASERTSVRASSGGYANAYGAGGHASLAASSRSTFETFFVKDCITHFAGIRTALQAALASSGAVMVAPGGYVLSGRVEDVVPVENGFADVSLTGTGYGAVSKGLLVTINLTVADRAGRIVFGAPIVTRIETDAAGAARGSGSISTMSGEGLYGALERQVALVAARKVAFHFRPLVVVRGTGRKVQLNFGGPLLEAGMMLSIASADGGSTARYRVVSTGEGIALAQQTGDADSSAIGPGGRATVIEKDDPAAGQSTLEKAELP